jgi:ribose transport system ATP-binding protein
VSDQTVRPGAEVQLPGEARDSKAGAGSAAVEYALELEGVSKSFVGVKALKNVTVRCKPGEVHALVGENGAGKSTLIKAAAGVLRPDSGRVRIGGVELRTPSALAARKLGLLTAYQDTSLVHELSVTENVLLSFQGTRPQGLRLDFADARRLLAPYDLPIDPEDRVGDLSPGQRQLLEIVRAMMHKPKVLLLDEPTAALDASTISRLETLIESARDDGVAVLYISHRLDEVRRLADQLTVIRDGEIQGSYDGKGWEFDEIVALMIGKRTDLAFPPKGSIASDAEMALQVKDFRGDGFGPANLSVRRGEIVGIAGAEGNGQRELIRTIVGLRKGSGTIELGGAQVKINSPAEAARRGISFQSGDRATESVFRELSVIDNSTLPARGEMGPLGSIMRSREKRAFTPVAERLGIVRASDSQMIGELSGGNQQKTVLSRALLQKPPVLIADEPTAGVDAGARMDLYRALRDEAAAGTAVLVNSSDATELHGLCDRVYVVSRGQIVSELTGDQVDESVIVESFVSSGAVRAAQVEDERGGSIISRVLGTLRNSSWLPPAVLVLLILAICAYTAGRSDAFLTSTNITSLLLLTMPLAVVALGQQALLIVGGFDISVGSTMTLTVVIASFVVTGETFIGSVPGLLLLLLVGIAVGLLNASIIRGLGASPLIATIATLSILEGVAILIRPEPGGLIGAGLTELLGTKVFSSIPLFFIFIVAAAVIGELALRSTWLGLRMRATGHSEEASRRSGVRIELLKVGAYVLCAVVAVIAGLFLSVQVSVGDNSVGVGYALPTFTACFLGGAALTGGRGSFVGAVLGALFVSLLINVTPLLRIDAAWASLLTGVLTIVAVIAYSLTSKRRTRRSSAPSNLATAGPAATATGGV